MDVIDGISTRPFGVVLKKSGWYDLAEAEVRELRRRE
jgi:hypothetical protein